MNLSLIFRTSASFLFHLDLFEHVFEMMIFWTGVSFNNCFLFSRFAGELVLRTSESDFVFIRRPVSARCVQLAHLEKLICIHMHNNYWVSVRYAQTHVGKVLSECFQNTIVFHLNFYKLAGKIL